MKQSEKSAHTKEKIVSTAMNLFLKKGIESVSVSEICQQAGIAIGTFYYYYTTKEDIFAQIDLEAAKHMEEAIAQIVYRDDPKEFILQFFDCYAQRNQTMGADVYARLQMDQYASKQAEQSGRKRLFGSLAKYLVAFQQEGWIAPDTDPVALSNQLFIIARGLIFEWCIQNASFNLRDQMRAYLIPYIEYYVKQEPGGVSVP